MATKSENNEIVIFEQVRGVMNFCILGTTPLIHHRMSEKAKGELFLGKETKSKSQKSSTAKHDPMKEYRDSPYISLNEQDETLIYILPTAFKGGMGTAAIDMPGVAKTQIKRHIYVNGFQCGVYGVPQIMCAITRSADINRTPDVRTRAIMPEWACKLTVEFTKPIFREQSIANLLASAGMVCGVGDWRQEKGSGNYGCYKLVSEDDPDFVRITQTQGRAAQIEALENPVPYDKETADLLSWFDIECRRRGFKVAA
jgi:hypothetical protein